MSRPQDAAADRDGVVTISASSLGLSLDDAFIEAVVMRVAEELAAHSEAPEPFISAEQAADHLACPLSRIRSLTSARRIPVHRAGRRTLYRVSELNEFVERGGARRP